MAAEVYKAADTTTVTDLDDRFEQLVHASATSHVMQVVFDDVQPDCTNKTVKLMTD